MKKYLSLTIISIAFIPAIALADGQPPSPRINQQPTMSQYDTYADSQDEFLEAPTTETNSIDGLLSDSGSGHEFCFTTLKDCLLIASDPKIADALGQPYTIPEWEIDFCFAQFQACIAI